MDTHGYIKWIHMGAQEPGCGTKLAAGPWAHGQGQGQGPWTGPGPKGPWTGPGPMGPWPTPPHPRAPPPVLCHSLALGPPYVSILCIHVCPYVHRCIHMYPYPLKSVLEVRTRSPYSTSVLEVRTRMSVNIYIYTPRGDYIGIN